MKELLKRILPEKLIWFLVNLVPPKPFLSDISQTERIVEYPWVYQHLPKQGKILDVGASGSFFAHSLASLGYEVEALDWKLNLPTHPNMLTIVSDIYKMDSNNKYDAITCISALEHIALRIDYHKVVDKLLKMLNPNGVLLITVPCGKEKMLKGYKVFDVNTFQDSEYFKRLKHGVWTKATKEEVANNDMKDKEEEKSIMCSQIRRVK